MAEPASEPREERCENCRFWDRGSTDNIDVGSCRRYPPKVSAWPQTFEGEWCGEWQAIRKAAPSELLNRDAGMTLELSVRVRKALLRLGVRTIGELIEQTADDLLHVKNFGLTCLHEVRTKLASVGLTLKGE